MDQKQATKIKPIPELNNSVWCPSADGFWAKIEVSPFHYNVWLWVGNLDFAKKQFSSFSRGVKDKDLRNSLKLKVGEINLDWCDGKTMPCRDLGANLVCFVQMRHTYADTFRSVSHEMFHIAEIILSDVGIKEDYPYVMHAYLVGWLVECTTILLEKWGKYK